MRNPNYRYYPQDNTIVNLESVSAIQKQGSRIIFFLPHGALTISQSLMTSEAAAKEMEKLLKILQPQKPKTI